MRAQWRWAVGMPLCRSREGSRWDVRSSIPGNRISRVLFCIHDGQIVALHGLIKKTQKTSPGDVKVAKMRTKEVTAHE